MPQDNDAKPAERTVAEANRAVRRDYPFGDTQDLEDARRGFMGTARDP